MPHRNVYHVVPHDGRWAVRLEGSATVSAETDDRAAAVDLAADILKSFGSGRVVVHDRDGLIEAVHALDALPLRGGVPWGPVLTAAALVFGVAVVWAVVRER